MRKTKVYYICDRCKKEILEDQINLASYTSWHYELCDECFKIYNEFNNKIDKIRKKWEKLEKEYKFGNYIYKDDLEEIE